MSNNIINKDNFKSLDGLQVVSKLVVNNGSDESFAILANQINWGDKTYTDGPNINKTYTSILGTYLAGPSTKDMFDALGEAINNKINDRINADGSINFPPVEIANYENKGPGARTYLANLIVDESNNHKLTAYYKPLPTIPNIGTTYYINGKNGFEPLADRSIQDSYYLHKITAEGHTLSAYFKELPSTPTISVKKTTGTATGKYISGISASGHSISYTYSDIPDISVKESVASSNVTTSAPGMSTVKYISEITAQGHEITYTCDYLPLLSIVGSPGSTSSNGIGDTRYISSITVGENDNEINYTYNELPRISVTSVVSTNVPNTDNNKYIKSISASDHHTINYEVADLPSLSIGNKTYISSNSFISSIAVDGHKISYTFSYFPQANQLWGNYIPQHLIPWIECDKYLIELTANASEDSSLPTVSPIKDSETVTITGNMTDIKITYEGENYFTANITTGEDVSTLTVKLKPSVRLDGTFNTVTNGNFRIKLTAEYEYGDPIDTYIEVKLYSPFTTTAPAPTPDNPATEAPNQVSSSTAPDPSVSPEPSVSPAPSGSPAPSVSPAPTTTDSSTVPPPPTTTPPLSSSVAQSDTVAN